MNAFNSARTPQTEFAPAPRECGGQSYQPHPAVSRPHNPGGTKCSGGLRRDRAAVSRTALPTPHSGQRDTSNPQCEPIRNRVQRARDTAAPAHLGALIAANPRTQAMIRDAVWAGLLPEQLLETRLSEVIETATSTYLSALAGDEQATARLFVQKAAQAADEAWQHTPPMMRTAMTWTSQRTRRADSVRRSSKRSSLSRLRRLQNTLLSKGGLAAGDKDRGLVPRSSLPQLAFPPGHALTTHDYITNVRKRLCNRVWVGGEK